MKVNEKYIQTMYIAFGHDARDIIRHHVENIVDTLESMTKDDRDAIFTVLDPEVKKAIIDD
jgi:Mg/Co/Ni transporter MgtE